MSVDVLLGLQWGDEGKGKIVDVLTPKYDIIARFQGGPNAGHTLIFEGNKHVLHTIPSGIFRDGIINIIGNGVVIDPVIFKTEIDKLKEKGLIIKNQLLLSKKAHIILPTHKLLDKASEIAKGKAKIGSTLKGIGPTYMDKTGRNGIRIGDLFEDDFKARYNNLVEKHKLLLNQYNIENIDEDIKSLEPAFFTGIDLIKSLKSIDSEHYINNAIRDGKTVLAEGAQGTLLDIDFGTYPFVTSSNTISAGTCTGLGIAPNRINKVIGIFKAYCTRVGSGPFPSEEDNETGERIRQIGSEFGATTGRKRRCGWIDLPALKYAIMINGVTELSMMKADVLDQFDIIKVCTHYIYKGEEIDYLPYNIDKDIEAQYIEIEGWNTDLTKMSSEDELPNKLIDYISYLEKELETPISIVSVGPDRQQTIHR